MVKSLAEMRPGEEGVLVDLQGGFGMVRRLDGLGLRPGKGIRKINAQFLRGPVVISLDNRRVALGYGMARRVIVEVPD